MNTTTALPPLPRARPASTPTRHRECWFWAGWEPDRFYKRIGGKTTRFFGNGDWIAPWRSRLESAESLAAVRDAGGSLLVTRFYKGFGPAVEREDWGLLGEFVERAHAHGLKVLGYLQGQSLFCEFLLDEFPQADEWIAKTPDGSRRRWGGAYNRFAPCLGNEDYRSMMESVVREGLLEVKLDGFHMDNNYYQHCYCGRCRDQFRQWLSDRGDLEAVTGIRSARHVEPPPLSAEAELVSDPLAILWIEFGVRQRLGFMRAIRDAIRAVRPEAALTGNPAFLKSYPSRLTHGFDPALEASACDGVCVENGNQPGFRGGALSTQADKHLLAEAASLRTWVTSWAPSESGAYGPPADRQMVWAGLAEEFSFHHASLGNNWALRPAGDASALLREAATAQWQAFEEASRYFQALEAQLGPEPRRQWGETALYIDTRAVSLAPSSDAHVLQAGIARLLIRRIPFKIVFQHQALPEECRTVLIFGQRSVETAEFERLAGLATSGRIELWLVGECGVVDEWGVPRGSGRWKAMSGGANVRLFGLPLHRLLKPGGPEKRYFHGATPSFTEKGTAALAPILAELEARQSVAVAAPEGVLANVERLGGSRLLVHLRDLREGASGVEARAVCVTLTASFGGVRGYSPGWADGKELPMTPGARGGGEISLPPFRHYACLLLQRPG